MSLLTQEHMAMFVVKSIHIQINGQLMDLSISPPVCTLYINQEKLHAWHF